MRGDVGTIKERLSLEEVIGQYVKLEKSGKSLKGRCPFHNEKTASFFVSPGRQSYYCFGCGAKGDIFTFVQEMEGMDFKSALKELAEKAGVELVYENPEVKTEKDKILSALEEATLFYQSNLESVGAAKKYLLSRGISEESIKAWRLGYALDDWRTLYKHLTTAGHSKEILLKAGLIKRSEDHKEKEPYDTFRGRVMFPLSDPNGKVIAFSGRALGDVEPKYLNSPDTLVFYKSSVLYGLDKAKEDIRKKNYAVLVEGQMDLVLSHQAGVKNTVASSGTAFTQAHLEKLKRLSPRIILAFDGDNAGKKAAEKSAILALALGMEVKVAHMPEGKDPADICRENVEEWKDILRASTHAIESVLDDVLTSEKDARKAGKAIQRRVLPLIALLDSAIEKSHFAVIVAKRSGIKEEVIWEDLKKTARPDITRPVMEKEDSDDAGEEGKAKGLRERIEERLKEIDEWQKELAASSRELEALTKEREELSERLAIVGLEEEIEALKLSVAGGADAEDSIKRIEELSRKRDEGRRKML